MLRSLTELFAAASAARKRDDLEHGAVGEYGYGFALADQYETARYIAGGSKLANLPSYSNTGLVAHIVGLVRGRVALRAHIEELFTLTLCAVSPAGGQRLVSCYHGPSGLALGAGHGDFTPDEGKALAEAWEVALRKAPTIDFQLAVGSDFGRSWLVVRDGKARFEKKQQSDVPAAPVFTTDDPAALQRALEEAEGDRCTAFDALYTAWESTSESARKPFARSYESRMKLLWPAALDELETALQGETLKCDAERAAPVLMFPQKFRLDAERQGRLIERWRKIVDRSTTRW